MLQAADIISDFLTGPLNRRAFRAFFELCHASAVGVLRHCRHSGYSLPVERSDSEAALSDLASSLLGELFRGDGTRPFDVIFDYFARHGVKSPDTVSPSELYRLFRILMAGYIKKALFKYRRGQQPQVERLKRRLKDILKPPEYSLLPDPSGIGHIVFPAGHRHTDHECRGTVEWAALERIVASSFVSSTSRVTWCREIFQQLGQENGHCPAVSLGPLLRLMVSVNAEAVFEYAPQPARPSVSDALTAVALESVTWLRQSVLPRFVQRQRLTPDESEAYARAALKYLQDLAASGQTAPVPEYFREEMPPASHPRYLDGYKYTFETTLARAREAFCTRIEAETTNPNLGDYLDRE